MSGVAEDRSDCVIRRAGRSRRDCGSGGGHGGGGEIGVKHRLSICGR